MALILAMLGAELTARYMLGLGDPPLIIAHPRIEYLSKPNQNVQRFGNTVIVNQFGMRSDSVAPEKVNPEELRVIVFGDSVVNGGALTDHSELATTLLQASLGKDLKRPVRVLNVSAGSWGPGNWLAYAEEFGFFNSDYVVLVISNHDISDNPDFAPLDKTQFPDTTPVSAVLEGLFRYLPRYLPDISGNEEHKPRYEKKISQEEITRGKDDLEQFLKLAMSTGAQVFLLNHFEKPEIENNSFRQGFYEIAEMCDSLSLVCVSLYKNLHNALQEDLNPYRDRIHLNQTGQALLFHVLSSTLLTDILGRD